MSLETLLTRDVVIRTPGSLTDRYGDTIDDWTGATDTCVKAWVAQVATSESHDHRDGTISNVVATFFLDAELTVRDRVIVDGETYEVEGAPNVACTPRGPHHLRVQLRAVAG